MQALFPPRGGVLLAKETTGRSSMQTWQQLPCCTQSSAPVQVAARVQALFPPRGGIRLLAKETTHGRGRALDYLIAQQLVLDTAHFFDGDKLACARRLAHGEGCFQGLQ